MSTDASELPPHDAEDLWLALTASQRGAAHQATGLPNQDAVAARHIQPDALVVAVADGHGHRRHFRSARGSRLAVVLACEAAQELAVRLDEFESARQIGSEVLGQLVPAITGRWREAVREDVAADPFTAQEEASRGGDHALIAYGSTLLLAITARRWLILVQIGDGDIMGIQPDGQPLLPVPRDPSLDGQQTTSLCGPRAEDDFRAAVVDSSTTALLGVLLATDGYGNAQAADPWTDPVSADLAELIHHRPPEWLAGQLPLWASRCASVDGSADDTTIALLIAPSTSGWRSAAPEEPAAGEVTTTAGRRLSEATTEPLGEADSTGEQGLAKSAVPARCRAVPAGPRVFARAPAARSRRLIVIVAVTVAVIATAAAFLAVRLSSSGGTPTSCSSPSAGTGKGVAASATAPAIGQQAGAASTPCRGG